MKKKLLALLTIILLVINTCFLGYYSYINRSAEIKELIRERDQYKQLYLKCNGIIITMNDKGKFDNNGYLKE
jgi:hypothetical protein